MGEQALIGWGPLLCRSTHCDVLRIEPSLCLPSLDVAWLTPTYCPLPGLSLGKMRQTYLAAVTHEHIKRLSSIYGIFSNCADSMFLAGAIEHH